MAKSGDVVEFKAGYNGIDAPNNLGIYLDRWRRKGQSTVKLLSVHGVLEMKAEHISKRIFKEAYTGDMKAEADMAARLRQLINVHSTGGLEEIVDDAGDIEQELWDATADEPRTLSVDELAAALYDEPSPAQRKAVLAALEPCRKPGVGRFETQGKGDLWRPWSRNERHAMTQAWNELAELRQAMLQRTEEGFQRTETIPEIPNWMVAAMEQWIVHDGLAPKDVAGIGGTGAAIAFGMDLHRNLAFLAGDWIATESTNRSSDYVHFLLEAGIWNPAKAMEMLMQRHVQREPFFEHVPDERAEAAAAELPEPSLVDGRTDLRHLECYTIDPPDAKDFDDAVGIEDIPGGKRLWVHIADVSHYVTPGSSLDHHAKTRATSVYLPGKVLPMLPHRIADHLCSLRDDGDRFALSVAMDIKDGRVVASKFEIGLIRVNENLAYGDALARRDAGQQPFVALFALAESMRSHRRGLGLDLGETRVAVADTFEATEKRADDATRMIETFMVAANEAVASAMHGQDVPLLYRCHPLPERAKMERYQEQLATCGVAVDMDVPAQAEDNTDMLSLLKSGGALTLGNMMGAPAASDEPETKPATPGFATLSDADQHSWLQPFHDATAALEALPAARQEVLLGKMLACMGQAFYTPDNLGHFGLASTHYCHFTSPIRRYPDLVVHRNLKAHLRGDELPHPDEELQQMCDHCSDQERAASAMERRLKTSALVLASVHVAGDGRITGIMPASVYVRAGGIEAGCRARDLPGGPYQVDEWESLLYHEGGSDMVGGVPASIRARLGDPVQVQLRGRDVADGKVSASLTFVS